MPPDICIEIALWDRFGWGPKDTEFFTFQRMKELFLVLEQQRVSRDAVENLGKPSAQKWNDIIAREEMERQKRSTPPKPPSGNTGTPPNPSNPKK